MQSAQSVDNIIHGRWILTVNPANTILENHALIIQQDKIIDILPSNEVSNKYQTNNEEKFTKHVLMPGFVNSHTHIPMNLLRGYADDLQLMDWLENHIWPVEKKFMSPEFVRMGSLHAMAEMIRGGTTCFNDSYFYPEVTADVAREVGIRASIGMFMIEFETPWAKTIAEAMEKGMQAYEAHQDSDTVHFTIAPHAIYTISDQTFGLIKDRADTYNLPVHIHVQETAFEVQESIKQTGKRPIRRFAEMGLLNERFIAVHMTQVDDEDLELLQQHGGQIVHCPESNMKLASGYCPVSKFQNAGINVALGTDSVASNNDLNMFGEMRSATMLAKLQQMNPESLPAASALEMATLNGAKALQLADQVGSLKVGATADFIAVDMARIETMPVYNPISQIVYACDREQVTDVWVAGKRLMQARNLTTIDEQVLMQELQDWNNKIAYS